MRFTWLWIAAYFGCQLSQCISNEITQHPHLRFRPLWTTKDSWGHFLCFGLFLHMFAFFCTFCSFAYMPRVRFMSFMMFHGFFSFGHQLRLCLRVRHPVQRESSIVWKNWLSAKTGPNRTRKYCRTLQGIVTTVGLRRSSWILKGSSQFNWGGIGLRRIGLRRTGQQFRTPNRPKISRYFNYFNKNGTNTCCSVMCCHLVLVR